ncbi:MAG: Mor transcription activator family protein, partial [Terrisporobacter sp.]
FMNITKDDIPYNLHFMVDIIGYKNFLEICKVYGGEILYIPVYKNVIRGDRNREMVKIYNGRNISDLSKKYGISKQQVKRLLEREGVI